MVSSICSLLQPLLHLSGKHDVLKCSHFSHVGFQCGLGVLVSRMYSGCQIHLALHLSLSQRYTLCVCLASDASQLADIDPRPSICYS